MLEIEIINDPAGYKVTKSSIEYIAVVSKGQLISEWNFGVFKSPQKPTNDEARAEILVEFGWLLGRIEDTENSFWD